MSLPPTSSAFSGSHNGFESRLTPSSEANQAPPELKTKKRKREIVDDMDVDGSTSGKCIDEKTEPYANGTLSEPVMKRRRTMPVDDETRNRVSDAIAVGDLDALKKICARAPDCVNHKRDDFVATPLLEAVWFGHTGIVRWLLEQGADPDLTSAAYYKNDIDEDSSELGNALIQRYLPKLEELEALTRIDAPILGYSAVVHAALHGDLEMIKLLVAYKASTDADDGRMSALGGAVAGRHTEVVRYLLQHGADPTREFEQNGKLKNSLSLALEAAQFEFVQMMVASTAEEKRQPALKTAIAKSAKYASSDFIERLTAGFPRLMQDLLAEQSPTGQPWMLELVLTKRNLELVRFLLDQGFTYKIRSDAELNLAANVSPDQALMALVSKGIESPELRLKFFSHCLYRNVISRNRGENDEELVVCNQWLIDEAGVLPFYVPDVRVDTKFDGYYWKDSLFHLAVSLDAREEVLGLLAKYRNINFHVEGIRGKYPIELAAELADPTLFLDFSSRLSKGIREQLISTWIEFFERSAVMHQNADAYELFKSQLAQVGVDPRQALQNKILHWRHWKALEFFLSRESIDSNPALMDVISGAPAVDRVMLIDLYFNFWKARGSGVPFVDYIESKKPPAYATQILDDLARQVGKSNHKFKRACLKLAQAYGVAGILIERTIETQAMLSFIRPALAGNGGNPAGFASQFSHFIAHRLPATDACSWYLISDSIYKQPMAPSVDACFHLATKTLGQLDGLHQTAKSRQVAWARKMVDELPALCLRFVNAQADEVDEKALQAELIQRDIVAPNAIRLAGLMRRAYPSARALTGSVLQSPALQLKQFSAQFSIEIAKLINDDEDKWVNQRATADALLQLNQPTYRELHLPPAMSTEFETEALGMMTYLIWWQMDAIFNCFGKSVAGESDAYARDYGPYLKMKKAFDGDYFSTWMFIENLRPGLQRSEIGSGFRYPKDFFGRPKQ